MVDLAAADLLQDELGLVGAELEDAARLVAPVAVQLLHAQGVSPVLCRVREAVSGVRGGFSKLTCGR